MLNLKTFILKRRMIIQTHYVSFINIIASRLITHKSLRTTGIVEKAEQHLFKEKEKLNAYVSSYFLALIETSYIEGNLPKEELVKNLVAIYNG